MRWSQRRLALAVPLSRATLFSAVAQLDSLGGITRYAKTTRHPFVSRLHFRTVAALLRCFWHLADAWHSVIVFELAVRSSHFRQIQERNRAE